MYPSGSESISSWDIEDEEESPVQLEPFIHQVGGHFPLVSLDTTTLCKPLNERELRFYQTLPPSLIPFAPSYKGTMKIETAEDEEGYITLTGQPPPNLITTSSSTMTTRDRIQ